MDNCLRCGKPLNFNKRCPPCERDSVSLYCVCCGYSNIKILRRLPKERPNQAPMCDYLCLDCDVEWQE